MKHLSRMEWKRKKNWIRRGKKSQQKERRCGSQKVNFDDETDQPWSLIWSTLESRHQMSEPPYKFLRVINIIAHNASKLALRMDKRYFFGKHRPSGWPDKSKFSCFHHFNLFVILPSDEANEKANKCDSCGARQDALEKEKRGQNKNHSPHHLFWDQFPSHWTIDENLWAQKVLKHKRHHLSSHFTIRKFSVGVELRQHDGTFIINAGDFISFALQHLSSPLVNPALESSSHERA